MSLEILGLPKEPISTNLTGLGIVLSCLDLLNEGLRDFRVEHTRKDTKLLLLAERLEAWDDRHVDAGGVSLVAEAVEVVVVVEELSHDILCAHIDLRLEALDVSLEVRGLGVLLRVAGDAVGEGDVGLLEERAVDRLAVVEVVDLLDEVDSELVGSLARDERLLVSIATEDEEVGYAEEVEVYEDVFSLLWGEAHADNMGDSRYIVAMPDSGSDSDGAGSLTDEDLAEVAVVASGHIDRLGVVSRDVDEEGFMLDQLVEVGEDLVEVLALEGREDFDREARLGSILKYLSYAHITTN